MKARAVVALTLSLGLVSMTVPSAEAKDGTAGRGYDVVRNGDGTVIRWHSCTPITWTLNLNGMPDSEQSVVKESFRKVARATGLKFAFQHEGMDANIPGAPPEWLEDDDLTVGFARPGNGRRQSTMLKKGAPGHAEVTTSVQRDGRTWIDGRAVVFNSEGLRAKTKDQRMAVYLHELGHVVGLQHVSGDSIMNPRNASRTSFSPGDLAGLRAVGKQPGDCLEGGVGWSDDALAQLEQDRAEAHGVAATPAMPTGFRATRQPNGDMLLTWTPGDSKPVSSYVFSVSAIDSEYTLAADEVTSASFTIPAAEVAQVSGAQVEVLVRALWADADHLHSSNFAKFTFTA